MDNVLVKNGIIRHDFITGKGKHGVVIMGTRTLRATWTPELAQELTNFHNIDDEAELTALLTENIAREIDNEILTNIRDLVTVLPEPEYIDPIQPRRTLLTANEVYEETVRTQTQQELRETTINRWNALGLLDGLDGDVRENILQLYEGQAATLLNDTPPEPTNFETVQFPMVRQVFARTVASHIIPVQPMNPPLPNLHRFQPIVQHNGFHHDLTGNHDLPQGLEINWRTDDTWSYVNLYGSRIGVSMELKPHDFLPKIKSSFDLTPLPNVNGMLV